MLKLEVGKTYKNRVGELIKITDLVRHPIFCFVDSEGSNYKETGEYYHNVESYKDLMYEYSQNKVEDHPNIKTVYMTEDTLTFDDKSEAIEHAKHLQRNNEYLVKKQKIKDILARYGRYDLSDIILENAEDIIEILKG